MWHILKINNKDIKATSLPGHELELNVNNKTFRTRPERIIYV